jgi:PTS system ascorbate-specific IIA component
MSVALLLVTHEAIGNNMLAITRAIINDELDNSACIEVPMDSETDTIQQHANKVIDSLDTEQGLLIITDSYGSTPFNIAMRLQHNIKSTLVSGLNLPMLLRIMNYRDRPLEELTRTAIEGGNKGIQTRSQ